MSNRILPGIFTRDTIDGGDGRIYGTTKIGASPASRKVRLFDGDSGRLIREEFSASDGAYEFDRIARENRNYFVVGHDHVGTYNGVIADRIAAEQMAAQTPSGIILDEFNSEAAAGVPPASLAYWDAALFHMDAQTGAAGGDSYLGSVTFLGMMDSLTDSSGVQTNAITLIGGATLDSTIKKFGASSLKVTAQNTDALTFTSVGNSFALSGINWTFDCWLYIADQTTATYFPIIATAQASAAGNGWSIGGYWGGASKTIQIAWNINHAGGATSTSFSFPANTWHFLSFSAENNGTTFTLKCWLNGALVATLSPSVKTWVDDNNAQVYVGKFAGNGYSNLTRYIDGCRMTRTIARNRVTCPIPTADFPTTLGVQVQASNGLTAYGTGAVEISNAQSMFGGFSLYADGLGYLDWVAPAIGLLNFTAEAWIRVVTIASGFAVVECRGTAADAAGFLFFVNAAGKLCVTTNNVTTVGLTALTADTWHHVALVRSFGRLRAYLNGLQQFNIANTANLSNTGLRIGHNFNASGTLSAGYIDEFRLTSGVGRYYPDGDGVTTDDKWSLVGLLIKADGTDGGSVFEDISDQRNSVSALNGAITSATQAKFGGTSAYFDGVDNYLSIPYSAALQGVMLHGNKYTIEMWVFPISVTASTTAALFTANYPGSGNIGASVFFSGSGLTSAGTRLAIGFYVGNTWYGAVAPTDNTLALNQWSHIALVANGTQLLLFVNGVQIASVASNSSSYSSQPILIGRRWDGGTNGYFNGYIDELRVTLGFDRYSGNFTPPAAPFLGPPTFTPPNAAFPDS